MTLTSWEQAPLITLKQVKLDTCGHDGHATMLLGAAKQLAKTRSFNGTVHLIFQPAEEAGEDSGAQQMITNGLLERFQCNAIFGIHNHPGINAGTFMFGLVLVHSCWSPTSVTS